MREDSLLRDYIVLILVTLGIMILSACSSSTSFRSDRAATGYSLGNLGSEWVRAEYPDRNFVNFSSARTRAQIGFQSLCKRYDDASLESLHQTLLRTISSLQIQGQRKFEMAGREALESRVRGRLDGVEVEAYFVTLRKNRCVFDFSLVSLGSITPGDIESFERFLEGFRYDKENP